MGVWGFVFLGFCLYACLGCVLVFVVVWRFYCCWGGILFGWIFLLLFGWGVLFVCLRLGFFFIGWVWFYGGFLNASGLSLKEAELEVHILLWRAEHKSF